MTEDPRRTIRKLNLVGLAITVLLVGGVGGWAATTQLAGAVIAPGTIVVEFEREEGAAPDRRRGRRDSWSRRATRSKRARSCCGSTIP